MSDPMLYLERVSRWHGQVIGLNDVSFQLPAGLTALLGPNGAGKSTLLKLVTGQLRPHTGRVLALGMDPFANPKLAARLGYCPEIDNFYEEMTGREFVTMLAAMSGIRGADAKKKVQAVMERVGMADRCDRRIGGYSKGMRQRIRLAQSIAHEPDVLILDEPLNGLDPLVRAETIALFREFAARGKHVILSSHVLQEVDVISDQVILISNGSIIAEGQIQNVREEMTEHPSQFLIRCPDAARVASLLFAEDHITEVRLHADRMGLLVLTRSRERFSHLLNQIVLNGQNIESIVQADSNVDSLYEYLIGGGR